MNISIVIFRSKKTARQDSCAVFIYGLFIFIGFLLSEFCEKIRQHGSALLFVNAALYFRLMIIRKRIEISNRTKRACFFIIRAEYHLFYTGIYNWRRRTSGMAQALHTCHTATAAIRRALYRRSL